MNNISLRSVLFGAVFATGMTGCTTWSLAENPPQVDAPTIGKATRGTCGVAPFKYNPASLDKTGKMTPGDVATWNDLFAKAVTHSSMCAKTVRLESSKDSTTIVDYVIDGDITNFDFRQEFIPASVFATLFTGGLYAIFNGPYADTSVEFGYTANLRDARTGSLLVSTPEYYSNQDTTSMYNRDNVRNPYTNPSIPFEATFNHSLQKMTEVLDRRAKAAPFAAQRVVAPITTHKQARRR